jgi:cyanate permease
MMDGMAETNHGPRLIEQDEEEPGADEAWAPLLYMWVLCALLAAVAWWANH